MDGATPASPRIQRRYDPDKEVVGSAVTEMAVPYFANEDFIHKSRSAMLSYISAESTLLKAVITDAYFCADKECIRSRVLLDSGAPDGSYIDEAFMNEIKDKVPGRIIPYNSEVILGDKKTKIRFKEIFEVDLFFEYRGVTYPAKVKLRVMPSLGENIIIGLPTIVNNILPMFCGMLYDVAEELAEHPEYMLTYLIEQPWSVIEEDAPEDLETPLPCAFTEHLHYLSISHDEAVREFYDQFDDEKDGRYRIHPKFKESSKIVELLKSQKGINTFVPDNWEGVFDENLNPVEIEFNWAKGLPASMKPLPRPINPRLFEAAHEELKRLLTYMYRPSDSPIASCLVVAPKATKPFIRFCGDYSTLVNKYIISGHYPIPRVFHEIQRICKHKVFLDFDMANSFHQFRLGPLTRSRLSVSTPWGQFEPVFMPEGVPPASGILQKHMESIFKGFEDWTVVIFDNLLVLAEDYKDAYEKCELILDRCRKRNLVLKFSKTWLGNDNVEFFGYRCSYDRFELTEKRKQSIMDIPFPTTTKQMQRFLGCALFFRQFMPNYAELTARLSDMTEKTFNWNKTAWKADYESAFAKFKEELLKATALYYPDYERTWYLRVDASEDAVGFALLQDRDGVPYKAGNSTDPPFEPILFGSKKFSKQARKWDMFNKEAYAMYFAVKECEYMLRGKQFILQSDHRNLSWIEASAVPKVIRWRIYLQSFMFMFDHIEGRRNIVADWQSRLFAFVMLSHDLEPNEQLSDDEFLFAISGITGRTASNNTVGATEGQSAEVITLSQSEMLKEVHGKRSGHMGVERTYRLLNRHFPGHKISISQVGTFVSECPVCQKVRLGMESALVPKVRHLKTRGPRAVVGIDYLSLEPDRHGNIGCYVTRDHFTKQVFIHPVKEHNATNAATAIFLHCVYFAKFDCLISDPGSDFTSEMIALLNHWFGIHHIFSLVDRHESNGVEGANKQILRHLKALICDERIRNRWSEPTVIGWISFLMNKFDDSESGVSPYELTFGSDIARSLKFPVNELSNSAPEFLKQLNKDLQELNAIAKDYQDKLVAARVDSSKEYNTYQQGDLVLFRHDPNKPLPEKLLTRYSGPYEVLKHLKNDVECRHLALKNIKTFYSGDLKPFIGDLTSAKQLAMVDADQFEIDSIVAHRGNPYRRTNMEFCVQFRGDSQPTWVNFSDDLFKTVQYGDYCASKPMLWRLLFTVEQSKQEAVRRNKLPITEVVPGDSVYVDLRFYGADPEVPGENWYRFLSLPDLDFKTYVVQFEYVKLLQRNRRITMKCDIMGDIFTWDHCTVMEWGTSKIFDSSTMVLVDENLVKKHPDIVDRSGV